MCRQMTIGLTAAVAVLAAGSAALAQVDADTYSNRPFYTYDMYDQLDGHDSGHGFYGGTDYLNYYDEDQDFYHDEDLYGDSVDLFDYGGRDYLGYDRSYNYDARDAYEDPPPRRRVDPRNDRLDRRNDRYWHYYGRDGDPGFDRAPRPTRYYRSGPWND